MVIYQKTKRIVLQICEFHPDGTVVYMDDMKVPYLYDGDFWIGFDNEQSVAEKVMESFNLM